jgi:arylsulfatase A-like enzyme
MFGSGGPFPRVAIFSVLAGVAVLWLRAWRTAATVALVAIAATPLGHTPVGASWPGTAAQTAPSEHDVIIVVLDTVRADHLSVYGYERDTTPALRELARGATVYRHAVSASDTTLSSHASLLTGLYPTFHGARHPAPGESIDGRAAFPLPDEVETLPEILRAHGYRTAAVLGNHGFLSPYYGLTQGFDFYERLEPGSCQGSWLPLASILRGRMTGTLPEWGQRYARAPRVNQEVLRYLDRTAGSGHPMFMLLNYVDAHSPYKPPPPFDTRFPGLDPTFSDAQYDLLKAGSLSRQREVTERERAHMTSQYDGSIAALDRSLGDLFAALRARDLYDNALIVVTSDHGEAFGEHGRFRHNASVHEDQVWVPLIVKYPRTVVGDVVERTVSTTDVLPTVLDVLGIRRALQVHGRSLLDPPDPDRLVLSESFELADLAGAPVPARRFERAAYRGSLKLIQSSDGPPQLYDVRRDPKELVNLYRPDAGEVRSIEAELDAWVASAPSIARQENGPGKEVLDRLRSLGYVR